jgi:hypothetical protein
MKGNRVPEPVAGHVPVSAVAGLGIETRQTIDQVTQGSFDRLWD